MCFSGLSAFSGVTFRVKAQQAVIVRLDQQPSPKNPIIPKNQANNAARRIRDCRNYYRRHLNGDPSRV
jgi:hypothetical protein